MLEVVNGLPEMNMDVSETGCCPKFNPENWESKLMTLKGLNMIKASTMSFLYMPLNMNSVMTNTLKLITDADANDAERYFVLSQDKSKWKCDHYFLVKHPIEGQNNVTFEGQFVTKVYEGDFSQMSKWVPDFEAFVKDQGQALRSFYTFYTTCPKCAKHYGKNYVVFFGEV